VTTSYDIEPGVGDPGYPKDPFTNLSQTQFGGAQGNEYTAPNGRIYTLSDHAGRTEAFTPGGRSAGRMSHSGPYTSEPEQKTIGNIEVSSQHRGKGVATALLDYARLREPDLHHSRILTGDGKNFAANSPRPWQPKLPLDPREVDESTGFTLNGPNGGENGPSPWKAYVDFGPKNKRSEMRAVANIEAARQRFNRPPSTDTQEKLF
jgi:GNAT superfamily N-acetyltransferase